MLSHILNFFVKKKVRFAVISDIHSNLEALSVVMEDIKNNEIKEIYCCGDIIGYGPNPNECVEIIIKNDIISVLGNHDYALNNPKKLYWFNSDAKNSIEWTDKNIKVGNKEFLKKLKEYYSNELFEIVHGSLRDSVFEYVFPDFILISQQIEKMKRKILFLGHTHYPFIFVEGKTNCKEKEYRYLLRYYKKDSTGVRNPKTIEDGYSDSYAINLFKQPNKTVETILIKDYDKVIVNVGSVGQPRDYNNMASYVICEIGKKDLKIKFVRLGYDYRKTQKKILKSGLPNKNAERLEIGR